MLNNCYTFNIDTYKDDRGYLSVLERDKNLPFEIQRLYYLYGTKNNSIRGVHAHKQLEQIIISFSGKYEILLDDGLNKKVLLLDNPSIGLYICPMIWREVKPIEDEGVCAVLASRKYEEEDYIHSYSEFLMLSSQK
jgi:dTDP-4-dehydrorhamnose 3,5-epimerase-like enzyme